MGVLNYGNDTKEAQGKGQCISKGSCTKEGRAAERYDEENGCTNAKNGCTRVKDKSYEEMINRFRRLLIQVGKVLPFVVCFLIAINYTETAFALATKDFLMYDGIVIPNTRISFFIGHYFEYNIQMLVVLVILSISIQTCVYNKLSCLYLGINLLEKSYFDFELEPTTIYIICALNIVASSYLTYKGLKILTQ